MGGALLIHDLRNPSSAANPATQLEHPLCLFQATAFHSGMWRCPYTIGSLSVPSAVRYYLTALWPPLVFWWRSSSTWPGAPCLGHSGRGGRFAGGDHGAPAGPIPCLRRSVVGSAVKWLVQVVHAAPFPQQYDCMSRDSCTEQRYPLEALTKACTDLSAISGAGSERFSSAPPLACKDVQLL